MSQIIFMCGPAGSGKTTVARQLESKGMVRLSFDQQAWRRGLRSMPLPGLDETEIDADLRQRLVELIDDGQDIVLDFSFWSRSMREDWRGVLAPFGIVPETIYLATPREVCLDRVRARALGNGDDFTLGAGLAADYFDRFEAPAHGEGPLTVLRG